MKKIGISWSYGIFREIHGTKTPLQKIIQHFRSVSMHIHAVI
jgi:hypothetical protein